MAALKKLSVGAMKPWFPESNLGESNFTCLFLLEKLREKCEEFRDLEKKYSVTNIKAKDISEGSGYLSKVYRCDIVLRPQDPASPGYALLYSCILKQPGFESIEAGFQGYSNLDDKAKESMKDEMIKVITKFHHNEVTFFRIFGKKPLPIPKCFGFGDWVPGKQSGYIIMEFLSKGKFPELHVGLTENQAMSLLQFVVKFQAMALKSRNEWKDEFTHVKFGESSDDQFGGICYENVQKGQSESFVKNMKKLKRFYCEHETSKYISGEPWLELGIQPMLIHGDLWSNNACFFYDYTSNQITDEICAVIDWQIVHEGNPLTDVSRVLLMCCNADIRRKLELTIIDWYLKALEAELGDEKVPFTREELEVSKRHSDLENLVFSIFMILIHYSEGNPEIEAKKKAYMKRVEDLMEDKIHMIEEFFPELISHVD